MFAERGHVVYHVGPDFTGRKADQEGGETHIPGMIGCLPDRELGVSHPQVACAILLAFARDDGRKLAAVCVLDKEGDDSARLQTRDSTLSPRQADAHPIPIVHRSGVLAVAESKLID